MGRRPLVSVIIPAYNGEKTIEYTLASILKQTYNPLEIIVINDCSKDRTEYIVKRFCKRDQRIRLIEHKKNLGLAATLNHGFSLVSGQFVMIVHQDCELLKQDWIDNALTSMNGNNKMAVVTGLPLYPINELNVYEKAFIIIRDTVTRTAEREEMTFSEFRCDMLRKEALIDAGGFCSQKFRISGEDQVLSYSLRKLGFKIIRFKELKYILRMNQESLLKNLKKEHTFGKTQAGIFLHTSMGMLSGVTESRDIMRRLVNRFMALFTFCVFAFTLLALPFFHNLNIPAIGLLALFVRSIQYAYRSLLHKSVFDLSLREVLLIPPMGLLADFIYGISFFMGSVLAVLKKKL